MNGRAAYILPIDRLYVGYSPAEWNVCATAGAGDRARQRGDLSLQDGGAQGGHRQSRGHWPRLEFVEAEGAGDIGQVGRALLDQFAPYRAARRISISMAATSSPARLPAVSSTIRSRSQIGRASCRERVESWVVGV